MKHKSTNYNLLVEPWIPVLWGCGRAGRVGIREAFMQAGRIRRIAGTNPMDNAAILRLLLAVLHWCKSTMDEAEREALLEGNGIPDHWVRDRLWTDGQPSTAFALLATNYGFLQDQGAWTELKLKENVNRKITKEMSVFRPSTDLLQELSSGTSVAHFRHTRDGQHGLCPGCCAMGLVRLAAFASASAHGKEAQKPAGINGATPAYIVSSGESLLEEFVLSWPQGSVKGDAPWWEDPNEPRSGDTIGPQRAFTWQPRRTWLERPREGQLPDRCSACAQETLLVYRIAFLPGWKRPFAKKPWPDDPHLLTVLRPVTKKGQASTVPISFPNPSQPLDVYAQAWRKTARAIIQRRMPASFQTPAAMTVCAGPAANKALYQDASSYVLRAPVGSNQALHQLQCLDRIDLRDCLLKAFPRNALQRPETGSALAAFAADMEKALNEHFENLLVGLATAGGHQNPEEHVRQWLETVRAILREVLQRSCALIGSGSALSRNEHVRRAWEALDRTMAELAETEIESAGAVTIHRPESGSQRRGAS